MTIEYTGTVAQARALDHLRVANNDAMYARERLANALAYADESMAMGTQATSNGEIANQGARLEAALASREAYANMAVNLGIDSDIVKAVASGEYVVVNFDKGE